MLKKFCFEASKEGILHFHYRIQYASKRPQCATSEQSEGECPPSETEELEEREEKWVEEYEDDEEGYDKPIPLTGEVDNDDSSSDEEPIYHNLRMVKNQQQHSFDSRLYGNVDLMKHRLEHSAHKMSHRYSSMHGDRLTTGHVPPRKSTKSMAPVMVPVMKPLMTSNNKHNISGVTEEESHTETGANMCMYGLCYRVTTTV